MATSKTVSSDYKTLWTWAVTNRSRRIVAEHTFENWDQQSCWCGDGQNIWWYRLHSRPYGRAQQKNVNFSFWLTAGSGLSWGWSFCFCILWPKAWILKLLRWTTSRSIIHFLILIYNKMLRLPSRLQGLEPETASIVKWNTYFTYWDHTCLMFKLLDQDLCQYIENRGEGLLLPGNGSIILHVATALQHQSSFRMLTSARWHGGGREVMESCRRVCITDFSLVFQVGHHSLFQASSYKAPEVLLGIRSRTEAIDMWSMGATLVAVDTAWSSFEREGGAWWAEPFNPTLKIHWPPAQQRTLAITLKVHW